MMRTLARLAVVAFATCAAAAPAAAQVEGAYDLVEINGLAIPAPSPAQDGVVWSKMSLVLTPERRFVWHVTAEMSGVPQPIEDEAEGTFVVTGDTLVLGSDHDANSIVRFRFVFRDGTLRLYDRHGVEYTLRRR